MSLLVVRVNKEGKMANSKCCVLCTALLKAVGISKIYYSTDSGEIVCQRVRDLEFDFISSGLERKKTYLDPTNIMLTIINIAIESK